MLLLVQKNRKKISRIDPNSKTSKVLEQKFASLGLQNPLKMRIKLMGSKVNSQQAYSHLFIKTMEKEWKREIWTIFGNFAQVWAS